MCLYLRITDLFRKTHKQDKPLARWIQPAPKPRRRMYR